MKPLPHEISLSVIGKIEIDGQAMVYQHTAKGTGNTRSYYGQDLQRRIHVVPTDPKTPAQIANRQRLAAATTAWQALSDAERADWNQRARRQPRTGFNLFVRNFCRTHPIQA